MELYVDFSSSSILLLFLIKYKFLNVNYESSIEILRALGQNNLLF